MVERLTAVLPGVSDDYEIIVVDDGSQDRTAEIATGLAAADPRVRLVRHQQNRGYGGALKSGFAASTKNYVFFTDGDGQFDVGEIPALLPYVPQHDVVIGYRIDRAEGGLRRVNAGAWNFLVRNLFGIPSRDVDCAFKLFDRRVFDVVHPEAEGAMISTEILARTVRAGFRVTEVGVHHYPRRHGTPTGGQSAGDRARVLRALQALPAHYPRVRSSTVMRR
jgi:glycosyltransferase involved in cell wall biosynthesis